MASRFMKIKRVIIPFMTLVVMTSQLAGCATMSSDEMLKSMQESPEVVIEYAVPDTGQQDSQQSLDGSGAVDIGGTQTIVDSNGTAVGVIDQQQEARELSGDELHNYFQLAYDSGAALEGDLETRILGELDILISLVDSDATIKLPGDYADQYRAWRPAEAEPISSFKDVYEVVFATGTVNTRSGPSTNDDKVGTLSRGDSATRIGIGTGDYEGWSLIQTQDWKIVYVSSDYLSTTKPSTGTTNNGTSTQGKPQGSTQQGKPQGGGQPSGDSGTVIDDGSSGVSSGSILSDPSKLTEGIDPNRDPWDTQYKPIYGGSGG